MIKLRNTRTTYGEIHKALHWIMASLIFSQFIMAWGGLHRLARRFASTLGMVLLARDRGLHAVALGYRATLMEVVQS